MIKKLPTCIDCKIQLKKYKSKRCPSCNFKFRSGINHPFYSKHHNKESNEKNRIAHLGKKLSSEHIEKIRKANTGKKRSEEFRNRMSIINTGRKQTEETRLKNSLVHKGMMAGEKHPNWKGGTSSKQGGYIYQWLDGRYRLQHRLIMEKHLGRKLLDSEVIHHIDKNRKNNDISNLEVADRGEHQRQHSLQNWRKQCAFS